MQSTEAEVAARPTLRWVASGAAAAEVAPPPFTKVPPGGPAVPARFGEAAPGGSFSGLSSLARSPSRRSLSFLFSSNAVES